MNSSAFFDQLHQIHDIYQRIEFMRATDYDLFMEDQPDAIASWFYDVRSIVHADMLADVFMKKYGPVVLCRESSYRENKFMTILDCLEEDEHWEGSAGNWLLKNSFRNFGFKRASECDARYLMRIYCARDVYAEDVDELITEEHERLRSIYDQILREVSERLFHPDKIQQWLEAGNEIETYMN